MQETEKPAGTVALSPPPPLLLFLFLSNYAATADLVEKNGLGKQLK